MGFGSCQHSQVSGNSKMRSWSCSHALQLCFFAARILTQHNHQLVIYLVGDDALETAGVFKTLSFVQQRRL